MKCQQCGGELTGTELFCPVCGNKIEAANQQVDKNQEENNRDSDSVSQGIKEESEIEPQTNSSDDLFWPYYSDDKYRNGLVTSTRVVTIIQSLLLIVCFWPAWKYKEYYGWGGMFKWFFINFIALGILFKFVGIDKHFGAMRLRKYDKLVETAGKDAAVVTIETQKSGIIRKILVGLAVICSFVITETLCNNAAYSYMASNAEMEENIEITEPSYVEYSNGQEETQAEFTNFQIGEPVLTDDFEFMVTNAYVLDYLEGKRIPEGAVYVVVEYEYKNISKRSISVGALPEVNLVDGYDAVYLQDADANWHFDSYSDEKQISNMNPGIKTKGAKIFEVAIDTLNAGGMRAYVQADSEFLIDIPLHYGDTLQNAYVENTEALDSYYGEDPDFILENYGSYSKEGDAGYGYVLEDSDRRYLTADELSYMSKFELRLARNEIYARHGRMFDSADLQDYFNSMDWYYGITPAAEFDESVLNEYEKANLILIREIENSK